MEVTVDSVGRMVVPKAIRDSLGIKPGTKLDVSIYSAGFNVVTEGRTARLMEVDGALVADSETVVTDDEVFTLIDAARR